MGKTPHTIMLHAPKIGLLLLLMSFAFTWNACDEDDIAVPKPRAYPRVIYPEKAYKKFDATYCNFSFDQPVYSVIEQDTTFFDEKAKSDCWFNLKVPSLNAQIYCSYYPIQNKAGFEKLVQDAFVMAQKHTVKASFIDELTVNRPKSHVHGMVFQIEGAAASSYQFFLTDSTRNFLRGALYINAQSKPDSLAPVIAFLKADVNKMIETLEWRK